MPHRHPYHLRLFVFVNLLFFSVFCFAQQSTDFKIIGAVPNTESAGSMGGGTKLYQIQVGAFRLPHNAELVFDRLTDASLNPVYEEYQDFIRVIAVGISAKNIPFHLEKLKAMGFKEVIIREDTGKYAVPQLPISTAVVPAVTSTEIGYRTIKMGETKNMADLAENKNITRWSSSTPSSVTVNSNGDVTGTGIGNAFVNINDTEYISIAVVPAENFYHVPEADVALLPENSRTARSSTGDLNEYRTEPTFRLAYRFNNRGENKGASGPNGGVDILGRGENYEWIWTTYEQGGWFYDLNGIQRIMVNGHQRDDTNGLELTVNPEFVYDQGVPYLQLRHVLYNPGNRTLTGQRFGASADVMINENDYASLEHQPYGAYMADSKTSPSLALMFIGESGNGIDPVDTLWLGMYSGGGHLDYIYDDSRYDINNSDSAIGFSYQHINLEPGETKEFIVRFTLARNED
jgi:hypothetical protein